MKKSKISLPVLNTLQNKHKYNTISILAWLSISAVFFIMTIIKGSYLSAHTTLPTPEVVFTLAGGVIAAFTYDKNKKITATIEHFLQAEEGKLISEKYIDRLALMKTKGRTVKLILQKYGVLGYIDQKTNLTPFQRARLVLCTLHLVKERHI